MSCAKPVGPPRSQLEGPAAAASGGSAPRGRRLVGCTPPPPYTPPQLHAETDSKELALATVATDKITLAGVQHTALHSRSSPLHRPGETALRVFAPHESAAALLAVLRQADLQTYVSQFTVRGVNIEAGL